MRTPRFARRVKNVVARVLNPDHADDADDAALSPAAWLPPAERPGGVDLVRRNSWRGSSLAAAARLTHVTPVPWDELALEFRARGYAVRAATPGAATARAGEATERVRVGVTRVFADLRTFVETSERRSRANWRTLEAGFERIDARLRVTEAHVRGDVTALTGALATAVRLRAVSAQAAAYLLTCH